MVKEGEVKLVIKDRGSARARALAAGDKSQNAAAPHIGLESYQISGCNQQWDEGHGSEVGVDVGADPYNGRLASSILHFPTSLQVGRPLPRLRQGVAPMSCGRYWGLFGLWCIIVTIFLPIGWIPLQTRPQGVPFAGSSARSAGAYGASKSAARAAEYMERFNVPKQNIDLVWLKSGGSVVQRGKKTYHFSERRANVGVYAGYAPMYDSSTTGYCERRTAKIDTQQTVGRPLMASGACPNWGKVIAFTDPSGKRVDTKRWENEIHGNVMPHSTTGCKLQASPGSSEVNKEEEGMSMYAGYMTSCPFNQAVYDKDMLPDGEYDPTICDFVTLANKLWFLDTVSPSMGKPFTPYAFHGNGGHRGYDYEGATSHVGCPPYAPPKTTSAMKNSHWLTEPFACSELSRCTNHCWPFADGQRCFRSLPAMYNLLTNECRLLGYHTQFFQQHSCAGSPTNAADKFYCVKPVKNAQTSSLVYISSHTRPDYETKCPPREPLLNVQWGVVLRSQYCQALPEAKVVENTTAEGCGQAVFENSSSDDDSLKLAQLHWATFTSDKCANMSASCRTTAKGRCALYNKAPECFFLNPGSLSFTSLSAADPSIAKGPDEVAVLPPDPCATVDCGKHGSCSDGKCECSHGWGGERCETRIPDCAGVVCQNNGYCDVKSGRCVCGPCYEGLTCEVKRTECCLTQQDCSNNGDCDTSSNRCVCKLCYEGPKCTVKTPKCCFTDKDCGLNEECDSSVNQCICQPGYTGKNCEAEGPLCKDELCSGAGQCDHDTGRCICNLCHYGNKCQAIRPDCCGSNDDCNAPREICDLSSNQCKCDPRFAGASCGDLVDDTCRKWCTPPAHLVDNAFECKGIDCLFLCCQSIGDCIAEDRENCYKERMEEEEGGRCCLGKRETSNVLVYVTAGGIGLLLLLGAVGAGVVYNRRKPRRMSAGGQFVEFDTGVGGRDDDGQNEEAIEVNLEDFRSHPDDKEDLTKKIISTTWDS